MILDCPRILKLRIWPLKPLAGLDRVLTRADKVDDTLSIVSTGVVVPDS